MCWLCWEVFVSKSYASRVLELSDENSADKKDLKIDAALDKLKQTRTVTPEKQSMFANWKEFRNPELYKPFAIMVAFFAIQQFSGIFVNANVFLHVISSNCFLFQVIFIYAAQFSLEAGVAIDEFLSAVIIGVIRCVTTIMVAFVADKVGKKPLTVSNCLSQWNVSVHAWLDPLCCFSFNRNQLSMASNRSPLHVHLHRNFWHPHISLRHGRWNVSSEESRLRCRHHNVSRLGHELRCHQNLLHRFWSLRIDGCFLILRNCVIDRNNVWRFCFTGDERKNFRRDWRDFQKTELDFRSIRFSA